MISPDCQNSLPVWDRLQIARNTPLLLLLRVHAHCSTAAWDVWETEIEVSESALNLQWKKNSDLPCVWPAIHSSSTHNCSFDGRYLAGCHLQYKQQSTISEKLNTVSKHHLINKQTQLFFFFFFGCFNISHHTEKESYVSALEPSRVIGDSYHEDTLKQK